MGLQDADYRAATGELIDATELPKGRCRPAGVSNTPGRSSTMNGR
jgi:hypothetical protein